MPYFIASVVLSVLAPVGLPDSASELLRFQGSHWWGEPIVSFVNCCQKHASLRRLNDASANYWVCGYANRQHELELEIGKNITESSFYKALHVADGLLLILDQDATPFSRIWCDYELYASITAPDKMLDIVTMCQLVGKHQAGAQMLSKSPLQGESAVAKSVREQSFPLSLLLKGLQVSLENGEATIQKDKDGILFEMGGHADLTTVAGKEVLQRNLKRANDALHSTFAILAWPQAMQRGILLDFAKGSAKSSKQKVKLPEILAMDDEREVLELSLAHFQVRYKKHETLEHHEKYSAYVQYIYFHRSDIVLYID